MKKILITGGAGFIGHNLIDRLLRVGGCDIICLDQRSVDFYPPQVKCVMGKFSDKELLRKILPGVDVVIHLGSNALPINNDYVTDVEQNLLGSITLINECENARVGKIVFASSGGTVYGPEAKVPTEEHEAPRPICSYGIIKVAVDNYLALASKHSGIKTVSLRIANPYGPWQNWNSAQGVIAVFCHHVLTEKEIPLFGDGTVERDFVYIDDVIDAFMAGIFNHALSLCVNIGSGASKSINEVIASIEVAAGKAAHIVRLPSRGCDVPRSLLDIKQAKAVLGWSPKTTWDQGVEKIVEWQRNNPDAF